MKVLHVLASNILSGAEQVAITIIRGLEQHIEFAYASPPGPIAESLKQLGIKFIPIPSMNRINVAKAVAQFKPDIIHAHDYRASILSASLFPSIPVISHLHSNYPWARRLNLKTAAYAAASTRFARIIVVSEAILNEHYFTGIFKEKALVLPNVIDIDRVRVMAERGEAEGCDLLFVGRLTEAKDPVAFIEIVAGIKTKVPDIKAIMIGAGELENACKDKIAEHYLEHNIKMLGFLANPYPYMLKGKMLVMPSKWEGFGLVALESMALGTPVLCKPVGGLTNLVKQGENGIICSSSDEFVKKALTLLQNDSLRQTVSINSETIANLASNTKGYFSEIRKLYGPAKPEN